MADQKIDVFCYAGHKGEEKPRSFLLNGERIQVSFIVREWLEEERERRRTKRFFQVEGSNGYTYTLFYDVIAAVWFLSDR